ncbi:MAG: PAS domain S-box protein, partial [Deltaproteobacteria bacterium]|nr:PAS domain S-box protein [Deltaproteobacteria bacterium]
MSGSSNVDRSAAGQASQLEAERSEALFRGVFEGSLEALMLLTERGFFECNARALQVFGVASREAFLAMHPSDASPPVQPDGRPSLEAAQEHIARALREGSCEFEWVHRRASGEDFPAAVRLSSIERDGSKVLLAAVSDLSARKQAEREAQQSAERLQRSERFYRGI